MSPKTRTIYLATLIAESTDLKIDDQLVREAAERLATNMNIEISAIGEVLRQRRIESRRAINFIAVSTNIKV